MTWWQFALIAAFGFIAGMLHERGVQAARRERRKLRRKR